MGFQSSNEIDTKLKEDLLTEINNTTNVNEQFKTRFIELLDEFTDPSTLVAKSFLDYVDQTRRNQYLNRLIIELEHISQNSKLLELLATLGRHLDTRFDKSKELFASEFTKSALNKPFKDQIKLVFDDLQLLTNDEIMLRYNRLLAHFSPTFENEPQDKITYNQFQHKVFVLKEVIIMEETRNTSEFYESRGRYYFKNKEFQHALVQYRTACRLALKKEKKIEMRIKMAECFQMISKIGDISKKDYAIFCALAAINFAYEMTEHDNQNDLLKNLKHDALNLYKTLREGQSQIDSMEKAKQLLLEKMMQIYFDKASQFQKYDTGLNVLNDNIGDNFDEILNRTKGKNVEEYARELLANNRADSVASFLNRIGEIYLSKDVKEAEKWLTTLFNLTETFIKHSRNDDIKHGHIGMY